MLSGQATAFLHRDATNSDAGRVWVVWARAGTGDALVELPVLRPKIECVRVDGTSEWLEPSAGRLRIQLHGDKKMAPGLLIVDRPETALP